MALDYFFCMRGGREGLGRGAVRELLVRDAGLGESAGSSILAGEHVQVSVLPPEGGADEVRVLFRVDKRHPEAGEDAMLALVLRMAAHFQPDAELSFQLEDEILAVRGGHIEMCADHEFWTEPRRAVLPGG